jgi:hypothetical protein
VLLAAALAGAGLLAFEASGAVSTRPETVEESVCRLVESSAKSRNLPAGFFTRLIWQESGFRADAVSSAGAQGIAQFMPATADERGLGNPFDPEQAIPAAADFLSELHAQFGNLGLAAAAYNAGAGRVNGWVSGRAKLPSETRRYVAAITRRPAEDWRRNKADLRKRDHAPCREVTAGLGKAHPRLAATSEAFSSWRIPFVGSLSRELARLARAWGFDGRSRGAIKGTSA